MKLSLEKEVRSKVKDVGLIIYKAGDNMVNHDGIEHAGYLSFVTLLAVFPFLVFFVAILGALGETQAGDQFIHAIINNAPKYVTDAIMPRINEILSGPPQGLLTISILGTIWTSSSIVEGMRTVLNRAYHVHTPPHFFWRRLVSIGQIFLLSIILIIAMIGLIIVPILFNKVYGLFLAYDAVNGGNSTYGPPYYSFFDAGWDFLRYVFAVLVMLFFVSTLYYVLPNVKHKWRDTLPGSCITVIFWLATAKIMAYYLINFSQFNLIYGSLANIIIFLLFFYVINIIFIYGAEFNYLLEKYLGHRIIQKEEVAPDEVKPGEELNRVENNDEIVIPDDKKR